MCTAALVVCDSFDDGSFLRADLSISCNDSNRRMSWVVFAIISLTIYLLGGARSIAMYVYQLSILAVVKQNLSLVRTFYSTYFDFHDDVPAPAFHPQTGHQFTRTQHEPGYKHDISTVRKIQAREKLHCDPDSRDGLVAT